MAKRSAGGITTVKDNDGRFHCYHCSSQYVPEGHVCVPMLMALDDLHAADLAAEPDEVLRIPGPQPGPMTRLRRWLRNRRG